MARLTGKDGSVTWAGSNDVTHVTAWTMSITQNVEDATSFADANTGATSAIATGLATATGSVTITLDDALGNTPGLPAAAAAALALQVNSTTHQYSFSAVLSDISVDTSPNAQATATYSFTSTGAITATWP